MYDPVVPLIRNSGPTLYRLSAPARLEAIARCAAELAPYVPLTAQQVAEHLDRLLETLRAGEPERELDGE